MSTAARARIANIGAFACAAILIMGAYSLASGQTACPAGDHLATADDVAKGVATAVGASCVNTVMAQNLNGGCGFDPYPIINAFRANTGVILTPAVGSDGKQDGINPILACRVAQFLQYAKSQGHSLVITSGYRSAAYQTQICEGICGSSCCSPNMSNGCAKGGACAPAGTSCHQYGLAVDIGGSTADMSWAHQYLGFRQAGPGASTYKIYFPLGAYDPPHIQCIENAMGSCNINTVGCGGSASGPAVAGNGSGTKIGSNITTTPGLGATQTYCSGNALVTQDSSGNVTQSQICTFGCLNGACMQQQQNSISQPYCSGNSIVYQGSFGIPMQGQVCPYGCYNGTCMPQQQSNAYATPPAGASQAGATPANQAVTGSVAPSTGSAVTGTTGAYPPISSSPLPGNTGSTIVSPTLAPNNNVLATPTMTPVVGTSALDLIDQIANEGSVATTTAATNTPIILNSSDNQVAQLEPNATPNGTLGISYANSGPSGAENPEQGNSVSYNTSAGSGYDNGASTTTIATIAGTEPQSGADTFTQQTTPAPVTESSSFFGISADTSSTLALLNTLKTAVEDILTFLSFYAQPFQGNIPSQSSSGD